MTNVSDYVDAIEHELSKAASNNFAGSINFNVNFFQGNISNMVVQLSKSVKMTTKQGG